MSRSEESAAIYDEFAQLRRKLVRAGVKPEDLRPFAVTPEEMANLKFHYRFPIENLRGGPTYHIHGVPIQESCGY